MTITDFYAKDRAAWRQWLEDNHESQDAVWLIYDKGKNRTMSWQDMVQEALCFGWIDSRPGKVSETQSKIYVSRRKPKSVWSQINKRHIEYLQKAGLMRPAGEQAVAVARSNGSWSALEKSDNLELPPELTQLLEQHPKAKAHFFEFSESTKKNILQWIYSAKTDSTRLKRIHTTVEKAKRGEKANQYVAKDSKAEGEN